MTSTTAFFVFVRARILDKARPLLKTRWDYFDESIERLILDLNMMINTFNLVS